MARKLASIKQVSQLLPIEGRDRIELAIIDGWQVIVKKDEFKAGDPCVYCEIDSVMPERPEFEFLRKKNFRIKTIKMAGVISQGICFPMSILPEGGEGAYALNEDVTGVLGIHQYEPTMDKEPETKQSNLSKNPLMRFTWYRKLFKKKKTNKGFPTFINKTDETRIQNIPWIVSDKEPWVATEKIDGQSGSFALVRHKSALPFLPDKFEYIVCSRNLRLSAKDNSSYWKVSERYDIENILCKLIGDNDWVAIQGECIAPNVQGNKYKVGSPDLFVFNLIYPNGRLGSVEARDKVTAYGLKFVPIINTNYILPDTVNEVLDYAHGKSMIEPTLREGIVFRSQDGQKSFKAVDPLFLIKYNE